MTTLLVPLAGLWFAATLPAETAACDPVVVYRSGSDAYEEAAEGIREVLARSNCHPEFLDLADASSEKPLAKAIAGHRALVTIGAGAWQKAAPGNPAIAALVLRRDLPAGNGTNAVFADVPLTTILENLRELFPHKARVAWVRRPQSIAVDAATLNRARQLGWELIPVECAGPDKLMATFSSLKGRADLVVAEPDAELYNSATVKPLVLASLDQRLPIVGFSAGFVRAGALVGVYPDFRELGRQTGELILDLAAGRVTRGGENLRKVVVAINPRIVRLMGLEPVRREGVVEIK